MSPYPDSVIFESPAAPATTVHMEGGTPSLPQTLLHWLLDKHIVLHEEWEELPESDRHRLEHALTIDELLHALHQRHLITRFQMEAIRKGNGHELLLGSYRLLDLLGHGGMGTVYRGEHITLRRQVAVKVMSRTSDGNERMVHRFYAEARAVARLQHPNIVACFDAGRWEQPGPTPTYRDYFVMELIPGQDLYTLVREKGPLTPHRACDLFRQVAEALAEAHRHGLIHRDIKPSNILVTPDWQAKVLDFGLARMPMRNVTEPGTLLGTIGYMAPEQARDPRNVDGRADLFSLGASLYWALTGVEPYPETGNPLQDLHRRLTTSPPPVHQLRPEVPQEVSDLVARLMQTDPDQRFPSARAVASTLTGFCLWLPNTTAALSHQATSCTSKRERILIVDDEDSIRLLMTQLLKDRYELREATDAESAYEELARFSPDLLVVDVNLPGWSGTELIAKVRSAGWDSDRLKVLLMSGMIPDEALGGLATTGADDFLAKPFKPSEFVSRVRALLMRRAQSNGSESAQPTQRISNAWTQRQAPAKPASVPTLRHAAPAEALSLTFSRLLAETSLVSEGHWRRIIRYVRALAGAVVDQGEYTRLKDDAYLELLAAIAPIYDIGMVAIPRGLLIKPDRLSEEEIAVVQTHVTVGAEVMLSAAAKLGSELPFLPLAAEIVRHHHERWDGSGYPDMLKGHEIPLSARVVSLVSVYEALRSRRPYRPALSHTRAVKLLSQDLQSHFDPHLLAAFLEAAPRFEQIHSEG